MIESGYAIAENVFSSGECDELLTLLSDPATRSGTERSRAGARHLMRVPAIAALANDRRLLSLAAEALGSALPFRATLFDKSPQTNWLIPWHQDTALPFEVTFDAPNWGPWSVKAGVQYAHAPEWALQRVVALRLSLDASTEQNGPLRVIPGSHLQGVLGDEAVDECVRTLPQLPCLTGRGGIVIMRPLILHASSKALNDSPRRVLHIEYATALELAPGVRLAIV